jgi:hypothetical protein
MSETRARRAVAEARIRKPGGRRRLTRDEITSLVTALGDVMRVLRDADPADEAEVYSRLGLTLTYHPEGKRVIGVPAARTLISYSGESSVAVRQGPGALVHAEFAVGVVGGMRVAGGVERGGLGR